MLSITLTLITSEYFSDVIKFRPICIGPMKDGDLCYKSVSTLYFKSQEMTKRKKGKWRDA